MLKKYRDFLFESLILESIIVYSANFKNLIKAIDSPVAQALLDIEGKDITVANNFIDISDSKEQISFIQDRKAQEILDPKNAKKTAIFTGGGILTHSPSNGAIFKLLDYEPVGDKMWRPESGVKGEILSTAVGPTSGKTYLKMQFPGGVSIINQDNVRFEDVSKLPFEKNRQTIRVGRGVKGILQSLETKFSEAEIEQFVNKYKAEWEKSKDVFRRFELVSGDKIGHWYNSSNYELNQKGTLSTSCMARVPSSYFEIYMKNPDVCQLLILKSEDGTKIRGRALVWKLNTPDITFMDRVYTHEDSDQDLFREYAKTNGWYQKRNFNHVNSTDVFAPDGSPTKFNQLSVVLKSGEYSKYPYLDTLKFYNPSSGRLSTDNQTGEDCQLEDTGGSFINSDTCDHCGGDGRVDCYECDGNGDWRCGDCDGDGDVDCNNCEGSGKETCSKCDGDTEVDCDTCDGSGKDPDNEEEDCPDCSGKGKVQCLKCDGEGEKDCSDCRGSGKESCGNCGGNGRVECSECDGNGRLDCPECS